MFKTVVPISLKDLEVVGQPQLNLFVIVGKVKEQQHNNVIIQEYSWLI